MHYNRVGMRCDVKVYLDGRWVWGRYIEDRKSGVFVEASANPDGASSFKRRVIVSEDKVDWVYGQELRQS